MNQTTGEKMARAALPFLGVIAGLGCATSPRVVEPVESSGVTGTYRVELYERARTTGSGRLTQGWLILTSSVLSKRQLRALDARGGLGEGGNGIASDQVNGCIRWIAESGSATPSPAVAPVRWSAAHDSVYVLLSFVVDAGYALHWAQQDRDTLRGVGEQIAFRLANQPSPPLDSLLLVRVAPAAPERCAEASR